MNRISIVGTGYVGLVSGACLAEFGHDVICMDIDQQKIEKLEQGVVPIYEPGLDELVMRNIHAGRLHFTADYRQAVVHSTVIFIAVGTPPKEDGSADLQYVLSAARMIARYMDHYCVVVDKSTVPVGTGYKVKKIISSALKERGVEIPFDVVSNPEFLREGVAIKEFMHPDRIVIGAESENARQIMKKIYHVIYLNNHPFVFTNIPTAEMIKYASNSFLATKIAFVNEMADLCEAVGANIQDITHSMGLDGRIGKYFLHAGPGYGGSCFPKDTKAVVQTGRENGCEMSIVQSVVASNERQKHRMIGKVEKAMGCVSGKTIAVLGLAFKPGTDDIRESPAITVIRGLMEKGAKIRAYDPVAMENARSLGLKGLNVYYALDEYDCMAGADAIVIVTEWNQFRNLDFERITKNSNAGYFFDLRNIYEKEEIENSGLRYIGVGK